MEHANEILEMSLRRSRALNTYRVTVEATINQAKNGYITTQEYNQRIARAERILDAELAAIRQGGMSCANA